MECASLWSYLTCRSSKTLTYCRFPERRLDREAISFNCGWTPYPGAPTLYSLVVVSCSRGPSDQVRAITTLSYRNQALCYSRTVAYFSGSAMLFSSGDSPKNASSILSGERLDEVQPGESPFVFSAAFDAPTSLTPATANTYSGQAALRRQYGEMARLSTTPRIVPKSGVFGNLPVRSTLRRVKRYLEG
jgi:hypothetical protein